MDYNIVQFSLLFRRTGIVAFVVWQHKLLDEIIYGTYHHRFLLESKDHNVSTTYMYMYMYMVILVIIQRIFKAYMVHGSANKVTKHNCTIEKFHLPYNCSPQHIQCSGYLKTGFVLFLHFLPEKIQLHCMWQVRMVVMM